MEPAVALAGPVLTTVRRGGVRIDSPPNPARGEVVGSGGVMGAGGVTVAADVAGGSTGGFAGTLPAAGGGLFGGTGGGGGGGGGGQTSSSPSSWPSNGGWASELVVDVGSSRDGHAAGALPPRAASRVAGCETTCRLPAASAADATARAMTRRATAVSSAPQPTRRRRGDGNGAMDSPQSSEVRCQRFREEAVAAFRPYCGSGISDKLR